MQTADGMPRVMLVDDHDLFRSGLRRLLEEEGFELVEAPSGESAVRLAASFRPRVVLMDLHMPRMDGIEVTRELSRALPETAVVMLTVAVDDAAVLDAVRAGAKGYLLKDSPLPEIIAAINACAAGHAVITPRVARGVVEALRARGPEAAAPQPPPRTPHDLSDRELEILALITRGCDNNEIADRLYLSASTVKSHVSAILEKLDVENRVQAAVHAVRTGLIDDAG